MTKLSGLSRKVFMDRYSRKDEEGNAVENTPDEMWDRVSEAVALVEPDEERRAVWKERFREVLDDFKFVPAGRILAGAGTGHDVTFFNCYVIPSPRDSRQGIMDSVGTMVEIMSRGGGVGVNLSSLRPRGAHVAGVNGTSSGPVSWAELYSTATGQVIQGGSRRGAIMIMLNDWHPDVAEFIKVKQDLSKINNANMSVCISDRFMQAVKEDRDWDLVFPDTTHPSYDSEWNGDLDRWQEAGLPVVTFDTVPARQIWEAIYRSAWNSGEPGVCFLERYNKESNSWYYNKIVSTNPCVAGDTLIYTGDGLHTARQLWEEGLGVGVVADGRRSTQRHLSASHVFMTGIKPVYQLLTAEGYRLKLTADHRVMTDRGWVEAQSLSRGDRVHILNRKGGFGSGGTLELGRVLGWLVGDGTVESAEAVLSFVGSDRDLAPAFAEAANNVLRPGQYREHSAGTTTTDDRHEVRVSSTRLRELAEAYGLDQNGFQVPAQVLTGSEELQRGFLQALFGADGQVNRVRRDRACTVKLTSRSLQLLENVQRLLLNFGIASRIHQESQPAEEKFLPDGNGGVKPYSVQAVYDLAIANDNVTRFAEEIGFLIEQKQERLDECLDGCTSGPFRERFMARVLSVSLVGEEPVFDLHEPVTNSFVANGLVVHNCGEQGLPPWGVCNLGAINLSKFVIEGQVDWEALRETTKTAVRFLDNVIEATPYHFEANREQQHNERRVGLGTMGLADMLIKLGVRYGSDESLEVVDCVYSAITHEAYRMSVDLAREKGSFPMLDVQKHLQGPFIQRLPEELRDDLAAHGIRNVTLITQAPTGSTSLLAATSSGIEPIFAMKYVRRDRIGTHEVWHPLVKEWLEEHGGDDIDDLPDYFVTASDLTPMDHVRMQAAIQKYTDSSISKTVNAPRDHTAEDAATVYMEAYDRGCKGVTYFREGSREAVLTRADDQETTGEEKTAPASDSGVPFGQLRPIKRPASLQGITYRKPTPVGNLYLTLNVRERHPFELFAQIGKAGSDVSAFTEAIARLVSLAFRCGIDPSEVAGELTGIGGSRSVGFGSNRVRSVPDAIGQFLTEYLRGLETREEADPDQLSVDDLASSAAEAAAGADESETHPGSENGSAKLSLNLCPECGTHALVYEEGCAKCLACGFSEC